MSPGTFRRWRRVPPREWVLPLVWAGLALACGVRAAIQIPDEMFITFRNAWNLVHGVGFVFNPG